MSCGPGTCQSSPRDLPVGRLANLGDEGFRLFFPLSAMYAALFPLVWVLAWNFDLPLAQTVSPSFWHAHEMLVGAFGAALIGFLTTAIPEWTDTEPPRGQPLWILAGLWGVGRIIGFTGWDSLSALGAVADVAWMTALTVWIVWLSWKRATDRLLAFVFWLGLLTASVVICRFGFVTDAFDTARLGLNLIGLAFLGLLGLALSRITVPVTNLILDPSERTSPFRPHPGRMNLAPSLVLVAMIGDVWGLSIAITGFLYIAAGAAFMDRVAEGFIGRDAFRTEPLMLAGSSLLAGTGLMLVGAARLGANWSEVVGLHVALMGGLGLGVYAVFCIAGLLHTGRTLVLGKLIGFGFAGLVLSVILRVLPEFGVDLPGGSHALASLFWAVAFGAWLVRYWQFVTAPSVGLASSSCQTQPSETSSTNPSTQAA